MKRKVGRPAGEMDLHRQRYMQQFGLHYKHRWKDLPSGLVLQLALCRSDCARRILLGISEKFTEAEKGVWGIADRPQRKPVKWAKPVREDKGRVARMVELARRVA